MAWLKKIQTMTNATKANIIATLNALLGVLITFHAVLTQAQLGAIDVAANAILALIVGLTFTESVKRVGPRGGVPAAAKPAAAAPAKPAVAKRIRKR